jgi:hypothetical protein
MAKHKARPRAAGRSVFVLGTGCGTLAVAAVVSAVYPVPAPAAIPQADRASTAISDELWGDVDESPPAAGPLDIPSIGVVLDDIDERYAAVNAARAAATSALSPAHGNSPTPARAQSPIEVLPAPPSDPVEIPPVAPAPPALPAPVVETPETPTVNEPAAVTPTVETPTVNEPAAVTPTVETPTVNEPAAVTPTVENPAAPQVADAKPSPTVPPTTSAPNPPAEEPPPFPPPPPPPADTVLALGERYDHLDADGTVDFSITLVSVEADLACTAPGSLPPANGHLIGLKVQLLAPTPVADAEPASIAEDFRFIGADDVVTADVDTDSSAACVAEADSWPSGRPGPDAPVEGTLVLDVPAVTGTIVFRPESLPTGLRWQV